MKIKVIDFETSDMPPEGGIVQIGWCEVRTYVSEPTEVGDTCSIFVNCGKPIAITAQAVHHICEKDLADAVNVDIGLLELTKDGPDVFCAHNAAFEQQFFAGAGKPWVCTLKVARRIWPDAPAFGNQVLRYHLRLDEMEGFEPWQAMPPHRAHADAYVTAWILREALKRATVEQMIEWTGHPTPTWQHQLRQAPRPTVVPTTSRLS